MIKLVQISDCHLFADNQASGYGQINPYQSLDNLLEKITIQPLDILIVTGDISADGSVSSYQHFQALLTRHQLLDKTWVIPGNHDDVVLLQRQVRDLSCRAPLSTGNWQIHGLNSKYQGAKGRISASQLKRLAEALAQAPERHHLLALHHHPLDTGSWMDKHPLLNRAELVRLIREFAQLRAVIYGHIHHAGETQEAHTRYFSCPSSCWQWALGDSFAVSAQAPGYRYLALRANGLIDSQVQRLWE